MVRNFVEKIKNGSQNFENNLHFAFYNLHFRVSANKLNQQ